MRTLKKDLLADQETVGVDIGSLAALPHQVAGYHSGVISNILNDKKGKIYKPYKPLSNPTYGHKVEPLQAGDDEITVSDKMVPVTKNELDFYNKAKATDDDTLKELRAMMPIFSGTILIKEVDHLILEDITHDFEKPCVLDLKLGKSRHYPSRPKEKLINDKKRYPSLPQTGFCIAGMKLYSTDQNEVQLHLSPEVTHHFTSKDVSEHIEKYLRPQLDNSSELIAKISAQLHRIFRWIREQKSFFFRGSSILIAYDAGALRAHDLQSPLKKLKADTPNGHAPKQAPPIVARVKMIDFAHVFHSSGGRDTNYLYGMENLVKLVDSFNKT